MRCDLHLGLYSLLIQIDFQATQPNQIYKITFVFSTVAITNKISTFVFVLRRTVQMLGVKLNVCGPF